MIKVTPEMRAAVLREMADEARTKRFKDESTQSASNEEAVITRLATEAESRVNYLEQRDKKVAS